MIASLEKIPGILESENLRLSPTSRIVHGAEIGRPPLSRSIYDAGKAGSVEINECSFISINRNLDPIVIELFFCSSRIDAEQCLSWPREMKDLGIKRIELEVFGTWISDDPSPRVSRVADHIACHSPGILTGTDKARSGEAFVDMRNVYDTCSEMLRFFKSDPAEPGNIVVWHAGSDESVTSDVLKAAKNAGCSAISSGLVPWAVGARVSGLEFAARIYF